jgi:ribosomal protein L35
LAQSKNAHRLRRLGKAANVHETDLYRITQNLPFTS